MQCVQGCIIHKGSFGVSPQPELSDMGVNIFGDSESFKAIADNPRSVSKSNRIDAKLYFIRGSVRTGGCMNLAHRKRKAACRCPVSHWLVERAIC